MIMHLMLAEYIFECERCYVIDYISISFKLILMLLTASVDCKYVYK